MSRVASGTVEVVMCDAYIDDPEYSVGSAPMGCRCVRIASRHVMVRGARVDLCEGCYVLLAAQPERVFYVDGDRRLVPLVKDEEGAMPIHAKGGYAQPEAPENPVPPSQRAVYGHSESPERWCATECHRGARPGCMQDMLGHACVPDLRDRIVELEARLAAAEEGRRLATDLATVEVHGVCRIAAALWLHHDAPLAEVEAAVRKVVAKLEIAERERQNAFDAHAKLSALVDFPYAGQWNELVRIIGERLRPSGDPVARVDRAADRLEQACAVYSTPEMGMTRGEWEQFYRAEAQAILAAADGEHVCASDNGEEP